MKWDVVGLFDRVNSDDVGVVEGSDGLRLALEAADPLGVVGHARRQRLESDLTVQARVVGHIHGAHPATPQALDDVIVPDNTADFHDAAI